MFCNRQFAQRKPKAEREVLLSAFLTGTAITLELEPTIRSRLIFVSEVVAQSFVTRSHSTKLFLRWIRVESLNSQMLRDDKTALTSPKRKGIGTLRVSKTRASVHEKDKGSVSLRLLLNRIAPSRLVPLSAQPCWQV